MSIKARFYVVNIGIGGIWAIRNSLTILRELVDIYGGDRVVAEPTIEGRPTFRSDLSVLDEALEDFYIIVDISALISQHRGWEDLKQLRRLMQETGASYGAFISKSLRYIFELFYEEGGLRGIPPRSRKTVHKDIEPYSRPRKSGSSSGV